LKSVDIGKGISHVAHFTSGDLGLIRLDMSTASGRDFLDGIARARATLWGYTFETFETGLHARALGLSWLSGG